MVRPVKRDPCANSGRLVHLTEYEHGIAQDARLLHLVPEVVALSRALANPGEDRHALMDGANVANQLLDNDGLAHPGSAIGADLTAPREWA